MSVLPRRDLLGRRLWPLALTGAVLGVAAAGPGAALAASPGKHHGTAQSAQSTPDQVIDAKANPDAAADALNSGCQDLSECTFKNDDAKFDTNTNGKPVYGSPSILGDVIYNCSDDEYAETAVGIEDERQESTSVSEKVSLKVSLSFLDLEKSSAEFEAFSTQSSAFSTSVKVTNAVAVPPGYKGWTVTRVLTGTITGSAYVTQGIDLIQVKNIDVSFPGYRDPADTSNDPVLYTGVKQRMSADDINAACGSLDTSIDTAALLKAAQAPPSNFQLSLCRAPGRCTSRKVAGSLPPDVRQAGAVLTRAGRTYGRGTYVRGKTTLNMRRPLKPGKYKLTLQERPTASQRAGTGPLRAIKTIVPITAD
jgi:hypothetical protein